MRNGFGRMIGLATALACAGCGIGAEPRTPIDAFTNVEAPATAVKGQPVHATLWLRNSDGCTGGPKARAVVDEAARTVTLMGDVGEVSPGVLCTQAVVTTPMPVIFTLSHAGTYTIKVRLDPTSSDRRGYAHLVPPLAHNDPQDVTLTLQVTE